jgi:hypothetical protein
VAAGLVLVAVLVGGGVALALTGNNRTTGNGPNTNQSTAGNNSGTQTPDNQTSGGPTGNASSAAPASQAAIPPDEQCTDAIKANPKWVCITSAVDDGTKLTIRYDANFGAGVTPTVNGGFHVHIYGGDGTTPPDRIEGTQAGGNAGVWYVEDKNPSVKLANSGDYKNIKGKPKVCARIANGSHALVQDTSGTYVTGNCWPIQRTG